MHIPTLEEELEQIVVDTTNVTEWSGHVRDRVTKALERLQQQRTAIAELAAIDLKLAPAPWDADIDDPGPGEVFTGKFSHPAHRGGEMTTPLYDCPDTARLLADMRNAVARLTASTKG
jgi:hypothetical protein